VSILPDCPKAAVVLNASAGTVTATEASALASRIRDAFGLVNLDVDVRVVARGQLTEAARTAAASNADIVVLAGGDGTLSTGAAALVGGDKPLGILPLGTLNHFARDAGIPVDLDQAVRTIAAGHVRRVDVGEVNGRIFLNNCSIGLYPSAVDQREELRHRRGSGKWLAMLHACVAVLRRYPLLSVTLRVQEKAAAIKTPFVFVGNNGYSMSFLSLGKRTQLEGGELGVYLARAGGRLALVRLALAALLGRLEQDRDFHSLMLEEVVIATRRRSLRVAVDGEVVRMTTPISCRVRPRALSVLTPAPPAAAPA
jgi:diacylglycerol kinase family enzyme